MSSCYFGQISGRGGAVHRCQGLCGSTPAPAAPVPSSGVLSQPLSRLQQLFQQRWRADGPLGTQQPGMGHSTPIAHGFSVRCGVSVPGASGVPGDMMSVLSCPSPAQGCSCGCRSRLLPSLAVLWEKSEQETSHWSSQGNRASPGATGMYSHSLGGNRESPRSWVVKPLMGVGSWESKSRVHPGLPEELL